MSAICQYCGIAIGQVKRFEMEMVRGCVLCRGKTGIVEAHTELISKKMVSRNPEYLKNICM